MLAILADRMIGVGYILQRCYWLGCEAWLRWVARCSWRCGWRCVARCRVRFRVDFSQPVDRYVRADLGRVETLVTQHRLQTA